MRSRNLPALNIKTVVVSLVLMGTGGWLALMAVPWYPPGWIEWLDSVHTNMLNASWIPDPKVGLVELDESAVASKRAGSAIEFGEVGCSLNILYQRVEAAATIRNTGETRSRQLQLTAVFVSDLDKDVASVDYVLPPLAAGAATDVSINGPATSGNARQYVTIRRCDLINGANNKRVRGTDYYGLFGDIKVPVQ